MSKKYQVTSQLNGLATEAATFEEIKAIREQFVRDYIAHCNLFAITVLIKDEDGFWVQSLADENGEPVVQPSVFSDSYGLDEEAQP